MTSKQIVYDTLNFKHFGRVPRDLWTVPAAWQEYPKEYEQIVQAYPSDISGAPLVLKNKGPEKGDMYEIGEAVDAWGCKFTNIKRGVIGEVKEPLVTDDDWNGAKNVNTPQHWLSLDIDETNKKIEEAFSDKFIFAGVPAPFEQLQFIRGTENLYMDLLDPPKKMLEFMERMHDFYCRYMAKLALLNVDALDFNDDWGSQRALLISPKLWEKYFMPMYADYAAVAKKHNKKVFMHSDGYILDIIPKLIDIGVDALNSQIFCMGVEKLRQFRGKITFWGEIDRQNILARQTQKDVREAVKLVYDNLYLNGGCIAQCEFGSGAKPENVMEVFKTWDLLQNQ